MMEAQNSTAAATGVNHQQQAPLSESLFRQHILFDLETLWSWNFCLGEKYLLDESMQFLCQSITVTLTLLRYNLLRFILTDIIVWSALSEDVHGLFLVVKLPESERSYFLLCM